MNKVVTGNRLLLKAVCFGLALILGVCLSAAGAIAASGCGTKCCCLSKAMSRHHTPQEQIRSSMDCCSGSAQMPCDLVSATELRLPEITLASSAGHLPTVAGSTGNFFDDLIDRHDSRGHALDPFTQKKFRSPPLYLQNLSFLI